MSFLADQLFDSGDIFDNVKITLIVLRLFIVICL